MVAEPGRRAGMGRVLHGVLVFVILPIVRPRLFLPAVRLLSALLCLLPTGAALLVGQGQSLRAARSWRCRCCSSHTLNPVPSTELLCGAKFTSWSSLHVCCLVKPFTKPILKRSATNAKWRRNVSQYCTANSEELDPPSQTATGLFPF